MEAPLLYILEILWLIVLALAVAAVLYGITLHTALCRVAPAERLMDPDTVWFCLFPGVNIVWDFIIASRVPDSLRSEFRARRQDDGTDYGKSIGLAKAVLGSLWCCLAQVSFISDIFLGRGVAELTLAAVSGVLLILWAVLFVMFWARIYNYSSMLVMEDDLKDGRYGIPPLGHEAKSANQCPTNAFRADHRDRFRSK